jgi:hypothetical protein
VWYLEGDHTVRTNSLSIIAATALTVVAVVCTPLLAGPPLICHPVEIGDAKCLPLDGGYTGTAEAIAILDAERDPLVHMETLRRATIAIGQDRTRALELAASLMSRALDAETAGETGPEAALRWLDAGYLVACLGQNGVRLDLPGAAAKPTRGAREVPGYAWVGRAVALDSENAGLHFAAALMTVDRGGPVHDEHLARARALAAGGTLLARNLAVHEDRYDSRAPGPRS